MQDETGATRLVAISGCSGGGKSTLLAELEARGHTSIKEPGRRVIAQESARRGNAYPWTDMTAFAIRAIDLAHADLDWAAKTFGLVFFDRGLVDAAAALERATGQALLSALWGQHYDAQVFMTPPWPELFENDDDRHHEFAEAVEEYERLLVTYRALGYQIHMIPKSDVAARADFVLACLAETPSGNKRGLGDVQDPGRKLT